MPDSRRHRGAHPQDSELFAPGNHGILRHAVEDYSWLLTRGYSPDAAIKLVGDRFSLRDRQRRAVIRSACSDSARRERTLKFRSVQTCGQDLVIDGYNVLITVESALSGGVILLGRDGACRDLASVHGTYRKVEETLPALRLIVQHLVASPVRQVLWLFDKPVSNSGRLKTLLAGELVQAERDASARLYWDIALVDRPDAGLAEAEVPVATADSAVLDRCRTWIDLPGELIRTKILSAWVVDLRPEAECGP